jgi:hypothetical protein
MLALALVDDRLFDAAIVGGLVGWLHDEVVLEVREDHEERAASILKQAMIDGFVTIFPGAPLAGLVEPHIGSNWGEAKTKPQTGSTQHSPRQEESDFGRIFAEQLDLRIPDAGVEEGRLRAREYVINFYRSHHSCSLEEAKAAVMAAVSF